MHAHRVEIVGWQPHGTTMRVAQTRFRLQIVQSERLDRHTD